jgi:hypothetical protein
MKEAAAKGQKSKAIATIVCVPFALALRRLSHEASCRLPLFVAGVFVAGACRLALCR